MIRARVAVILALMAGGCSGHASRQDQLNAAANQSTPAAANVLAGAAQNGMSPQTALNEAAEAQAANSGAKASQRTQARPNSAQDPNPPKPGEPVQQVPVNTQ